MRLASLNSTYKDTWHVFQQQPSVSNKRKSVQNQKWHVGLIHQILHQWLSHDNPGQGHYSINSEQQLNSSLIWWLKYFMFWVLVFFFFFSFLGQPWYYFPQFWHFWFILWWDRLSLRFWSFGKNIWSSRRRDKSQQSPMKNSFSSLWCPAQVAKSFSWPLHPPQPGGLLLLLHHHRGEKPNRRYHWERTLRFSLHVSWRTRTDKDHRRPLQSQARNSNWDRKTRAQPFWKRIKGRALSKRPWPARKTKCPRAKGFPRQQAKTHRSKRLALFSVPLMYVHGFQRTKVEV